jgi:hypothetical protein
MTNQVGPNERAIIATAIARLRAGIMAIVCGLLMGSGLLVATVWLVARGGRNVGQHLGLLRNYLPGYSVTWTGALLGFLYGAIAGGAIGWLTAWVYNRVVDLRHPDTSRHSS